MKVGTNGKRQGTIAVVNTYPFIVFCFHLILSNLLNRQGRLPLRATRVPPTPRRSEWSSKEQPELKTLQPRAKGETE